MLIWVIVAITAAIGAPATVIGALGILAVQPVVGAAALTGVAVTARLRRNRADRDREVSFLTDVTAVVASGSTLRSAIAGGAGNVVGPTTRRLCRSGMPMARVGESLRDALPTNGEAFAAVCDLSEETGSSLVPTLYLLIDRARETEAIARKRRIATAQARFSAAVVGIAPLVVTAALVAFRGVPGDGGPLVVVPIVVGAGLQITGVVTVLLVASRYS